MSTAAPLHRKLITPTTLVLAALTLIGFYFLFERFIHGLGAVANINSGYPWGLSVVVDVIIGTAFGCGGFAMALLVYIFNRSTYHPLIRAALLSGLFGYTLGGFAVIFDLGRYWHFYNLLLPWHAHADLVMLEVALCVMAYVVVLCIELAPAFLERFGLYGIRRALDRWMFVFAALGVLLPTMHQSSLGSMILVMSYKLSPLWYTEWLPALFVISALAMGYAIVMFEATVVSKSFALPSEHALISKLSKVVGWITVGWLSCCAGATCSPAMRCRWPSPAACACACSGSRTPSSLLRHWYSSPMRDAPASAPPSSVPLRCCWVAVCIGSMRTSSAIHRSPTGHTSRRRPR